MHRNRKIVAHYLPARMRTMALIFSLGVLTLIGAMMLVPRSSAPSKTLSQADFVAMFQSNLLAKVQVYYPPRLAQVGGVPVMLNQVRGTFYQTDASGRVLIAKGTPAESEFVAKVQLTPDLEQKLSIGSNFSFVSLNPLVQKVSDLFVPSK
jgi:hypothetical protein